MRTEAALLPSTMATKPLTLPVNAQKALNFFTTVGELSDRMELEAFYWLSVLILSILLFLFLSKGKLKTLKRTGWVNNSVFEPESVADHMYAENMVIFSVPDSVRL